MSTGALLTIISGTPGTGKTALAVKMILDFLTQSPDRPVFVAGIADLTIPHSPVPPVSEWTQVVPHPDDPSISYPQFTFPDGALIVVDEAQNFFRPRSSSSKVPDHVAAMERHRHKGLDFILLTQGPGMLDLNIRKLCGRYVHIRDTWQGRFLNEWSECVDPESVSNRRRSVQLRYRLPKKVFGMYKSSSMHVKRERRVPAMFWVFILALGLTAFLGYRVYEMLSGAIGGEASPPIAPESKLPCPAFSRSRLSLRALILSASFPMTGYPACRNAPRRRPCTTASGRFVACPPSPAVWRLQPAVAATPIRAPLPF